MEEKPCTNNSGCVCVGYAYIPIQQLEKTYTAEEALEKATLFPELSLTIKEYGYVCKQTGGCDNG